MRTKMRRRTRPITVDDMARHEVAPDVLDWRCMLTTDGPTDDLIAFARSLDVSDDRIVTGIWPYYLLTDKERARALRAGAVCETQGRRRERRGRQVFTAIWRLLVQDRPTSTRIA